MLVEGKIAFLAEAFRVVDIPAKDPISVFQGAVDQTGRDRFADSVAPMVL